jgi:hypothetical protein
VAQHQWFREVMEERDPVRKLQLNARNSRAAKTRIGAMFDILRNAAAVDPECASLWELIQTDFHENQRTIVESLARLGALRPGLTVARGTDVLWTLNHPDTWSLLHERCGWSAKAYETWLAETSCAQLLGPSS